MRIHRLRFPFLVLLAAAPLALAGCLDLTGGGDDSPADDPALQEVDDEIAEGVSSTALDAVVGSLENLGEWVNGGLSGARATTYDETEQAWTVEGQEVWEDEEAHGTLTFEWWIQFRARGEPQAQPDDFTDEVEIRLNATNTGNYHPAERGWNVDFSWNAVHELLASRNLDESIDYTGSGTIAGATTAHVGSIDRERTQHVQYEFDLSAPNGDACASGTLTGSLNNGAWTVAGEFDGAGGVVWSVLRDGAVVATDDRTYDCGPGTGGA